MISNTLSKHTAGGLEFHVRQGTSDIKSIDEVVDQKGYERTRPFRFAVEPNEVWLDLGANIGAFSALALSRGAVVIAVEPDPESAELAARNASAARILVAAVVADSRPSAVLHQNTAKGNVWRNSIERSWRGGEEVTVKCMSIEQILNIQEDRPWNIKMDIEGTEMPILEYLLTRPDLMKRINKLVFEWSFDVDPDLNRFRAVYSGLCDHFPNIVPRAMYIEHETWPKEWFPPCKTIFCMK